MESYGLSTLEMRALIERVFLPDICKSEVSHEGFLRLTVTSATMPTCCVSLSDISLERLGTVRAIAELVGDTRYLLAQQMRVQLNEPVRRKSIAGYSNPSR